MAPPSTRIAKKFRTTREKNLARTIDVRGFIQVNNNMYGDAARGCHHRGDGPDSSQRTISDQPPTSRRLVSEAARRNPRINGTSGPYHSEKEVCMMAAKKKAAKKPAAKKAAKKSTKKK
jgi:hypothetical protein